MQKLGGLEQEEKLSVGITRGALRTTRAGSTESTTKTTACPQNGSENQLPHLSPPIAPYPEALLVLFWAAYGFSLFVQQWMQKSPPSRIGSQHLLILLPLTHGQMTPSTPLLLLQDTCPCSL